MLARQYKLRRAQLTKKDSRITKRRGSARYIKTQVKKALLQETRDSSQDLTIERFINQLQRVKCYLTAAQTLRQGVLAVILHNQILKNQLEQTLSAPKLAIFLGVIKRENSVVAASCKQLEQQLREEALHSSCIQNLKQLEAEVRDTASINISSKGVKAEKTATPILRRGLRRVADQQTPSLQQLTLRDLFSPKLRQRGSIVAKVATYLSNISLAMHTLLLSLVL